MRLVFIFALLFPSLALAIPSKLVAESETTTKPPCESWLTASSKGMRVDLAALELPGIQLSPEERENVRAKLEFFAMALNARANGHNALDVGGEAMQIEGKLLLEILNGLTQESTQVLNKDLQNERAKNVNTHLLALQKRLTQRLSESRDLTMREITAYSFLAASAKEALSFNFDYHSPSFIDNWGFDIAGSTELDLDVFRDGKSSGDLAGLFGFLRHFGNFDRALYWPTATSMSPKEKLVLGFLPIFDHSWYMDMPTQKYKGIETAWANQDSAQSFQAKLFKKNATTASIAEALNRSYSIWAHMLAAAKNEADRKLIWKLRYDAVRDGAYVGEGDEGDLILDWTNPANLANFLFNQYIDEGIQGKSAQTIREADRSLLLLSNYPGWLEGTPASLRKLLERFPGEAVALRQLFIDSLPRKSSKENY